MLEVCWVCSSLLSWLRLSEDVLTPMVSPDPLLPFTSHPGWQLTGWGWVNLAILGERKEKQLNTISGVHLLQGFQPLKNIGSEMAEDAAH